jgi:hypothetical protein
VTTSNLSLYGLVIFWGWLGGGVDDRKNGESIAPQGVPPGETGFF